jgi:rhodanese-related sulfurtransferase
MTATCIAVVSATEAAGTRDPLRRDLIDVRTSGEFAAVHAEGARNVPLDRLDPAAVMAGRKGATTDGGVSTTVGPIYLICKSGKRATMAAEKFVAAGFDNVAVITGGTDAWVAAGLPVVRGKGVISLERQVRIAAGLLVLIGVVLGLTVNVWFIGLSAFVGAGLTFAGVTDTCGMAMILARMPWNKGGTCGK